MSLSDVVLENMAKVFAVFFGSANERALKRYWPIVEQVNDAWRGRTGKYGPAIHGLSDEALRAKTDELRRRSVEGATEDELLPEAFACCREASHRTLGGRQMVAARHQQLVVRGDKYSYEDVNEQIPLFAHFDVQILGGAVLHHGQIAEMVTGEGKTLVATLPSYLNALRPNDRWIELARREQGEDVSRWVFQPYGLFVERIYEDEPPPADAPAEGAGGEAPPPPPRRVKETRQVWRLMPRLWPDPQDETAVATWERPLEIVGVSRGVHVVTVNDYLAQRDADYNRPLFDALGITVGAIQSGMDSSERYPIYRGDIVYGTNSEYGFDYLRDNLKVRRQDQVQAGRFFAIVDEVDSVLIDEARTPLIISGSTHQTADKYHLADRVARRLHGGEGNAVEERIADLMRAGGLQREDARMKAEEDCDFVYSERDHSAKLTERGMNRVLRELGMDNLYDQENLDLPHYIDNALRAHSLYHKDHHYIVKDGQVFIVDEFTGRVLDGRRWSDGLHQAVEAKEHLRIKEESQTVATITYQNFFRLYERLAGMTGTAMTEAKEFDRIYKLGVIAIPTNRPLRRVNYPDLVYGTLKEKYAALIDHVEEVHATGRPILIGTVSIERSELISQMLKSRGIPHDVLNAKNHAREAGIVQNAGLFGAVVVATNMAGRGTDIKLGEFTRAELIGHWQRRGLAPAKMPSPDAPDAALLEALLPEWVEHYLTDVIEKEAFSSKTPEEWWKLLEERWKDYGMIGPRLSTRVADLGGLHIVGTERHEARRIDNQLRGRSGRQGDPGSSRFFLSLDDDTMRMFASDKVKGLMQWMGLKDGVPIESRMVTRTVENAQRKVEERNFETRKNLIEYDQVMNDQRTVVYGRRQDWVEDQNTREAMVEYCRNVIDARVAQELSGSVEDWHFDDLARFMKDTFNVDVDTDDLDRLRAAPEPDAKIGDLLIERFEAAYDGKEQALGPDLMRLLEKMILIEKLDAKWMDHLAAMDLLKEGIHLRSIAGQDPKIRYKIEGFEMFKEMWRNVEKDVAELVMKVTLAQPREVRQTVEATETRHDEYDRRADAANAVGAEAGEAAKPRPIVNRVRRPGPNDPCPCGSGKKFKKCHGK